MREREPAFPPPRSGEGGQGGEVTWRVHLARRQPGRAVGAVTAAFQLGWIPQLLVAGYVERTERKWRWLQWFGGVERLPVLVLTMSALAAPAVGSPIVWVV